MSAIQQESALAHDLQGEISAMNHEFLTLASHPQVAGHPQVLGLDAGLVSVLQSMNAGQLKSLASSPVLLVGFSSLIKNEARSDIYQVAESHATAEWLDSVSAYANRLLATLWHYSRHANELAGLFLGLDIQVMRILANMSFDELGNRAPLICTSLNARLTDYSACWADMVRMAINNDEKLSVAQLSLIPLSVAIDYGHQ